MTPKIKINGEFGSIDKEFGKQTEEMLYRDYPIEVPVYDDGRYDCPICSYHHTFDTHSGVRQHISSNHTLKVFRECGFEDCDEVFKVSSNHNKKEYCSISCASKATAKKHERVECTCDLEGCDETFERLPKRVNENNYCCTTHHKESLKK